MKKIEVEVHGQKFSVETGKLARQADGSTVITCGDTMLLSTVVASQDAREGIDFFPLTVDYQEKTYSAGKIPGGFFKREGRLSEKEILTSRIIDRTIRPLFPKGFKCETQCIVTVLSFGDENVSDMLSVTGVSTALMISDIPFAGPVSAVRIGRVEGELVVNPDLDKMEEADLELVVSGTDDAVVMVEGKAKEISEEEMIDAIDIAHAAIKVINDSQRKLQAEIGKPKREFAVEEEDADFVAKVTAYATEKVLAVVTKDKLERQKQLSAVKSEVKAHFKSDDTDRSKEISGILGGIEKKAVRGTIIKDGIRADGRKVDEVRQITIETGVLPRAHGSAVFTRGETQALVVTTLGTREDEQKIDALEGEYYRKFMLHYNFPPFSVGEARFLRGPGRREIGHGSLADKAVAGMLPDAEDFPYTIRIVSEILESNGSSSMATVCGASLSMMDAGVPLSAPVAGIAMGLVKEGDDIQVLTDILGLEDHLGDMDFKVTGTEAGITAFQMDVKIAGIDKPIMQKALAQAKEGRLHILGKMKDAMDTHRDQLSPHAPRIYTMQIKQDKIRDVIGTGGKVIKGIIDETGVKMNINDDGLINIASVDEDSAERAMEIVRGIVAEPEVGVIYKGKVVRITDFGAFVQIMPNTDGLLHISQITHRRLEKVTDELKEGQEIDVKVIEIDKMGRVRLGRKELLNKDDADSGKND